jgi:hypothetical protein
MTHELLDLELHVSADRHVEFYLEKMDQAVGMWYVLRGKRVTKLREHAHSASDNTVYMLPQLAGGGGGMSVSYPDSKQVLHEKCMMASRYHGQASVVAPHMYMIA